MRIKNVSYAGNPQSNTVMYITKKVESLIENLKSVKNCLVFIDEGMTVPIYVTGLGHEFVKCKSPQHEYAKYVNDIYIEQLLSDAKRHYTMLDTGSFIGENVAIGADSILEPGCIIGHGVQIGRNAHIKAGAVIKNAIVGDNFTACEQCTIGTSGFTMAKDESGNLTRIPTLGNVIIGNNVEIGANSDISRGSAGSTIICDNVKIDALVHIGHDQYLEKNVEITCGSIFGGYARLKENSFFGLNSTVRNRIVVGENVKVGMGAVLTKSVGDNETVVGNPAKPFVK